TCNDPDRPVVDLRVKWFVERSVELTPATLDFGRVRPGERVTKVVAVERSVQFRKAPLALQSLDSQISASPGPTDSEKKETIHVTLVAGAGPGSHTGFVKVSDAPLVLPVVWEVSGDVIAVPRALFTPSASKDTAIQGRVVLRSLDGRPFRIKGVEVENLAMQEPQLPEGENAEREVILRVRAPRERGVHRGKIHVKTNMSADDTLTIPWTVVVQ
ncbi:MAG: hypothetical protein ACP5XB_21030, partial [Isosphaeraceae bacterium]